jgi:2-dehydro-3-deoxyphosphooctonate aldolase (KDO 8-P synthase)
MGGSAIAVGKSKRKQENKMIKCVEIPKPREGKLVVANNRKLTIIAGPCQMESRQQALEMSAAIAEIGRKLDVQMIYKTSFDKANRSSINTQRGLGLEEALPIMAEVREKSGLPVLTDVHETIQCPIVGEVVDVLQIPAFLCRQTDLLLAAGKTGKVIHVKKGQFMAPWDMKNVAAKIASTGNENIMLCERGASFGYNTLVSDMRSLPIMAETGYPVIFDATHSVQQPGGKGDCSGGERRFVSSLARAAVAVGVAGVFIETHPDPDHAPSDGPNMIPFARFEEMVETLLAYDALTKSKGNMDFT